MKKFSFINIHNDLVCVNVKSNHLISAKLILDKIVKNSDDYKLNKRGPKVKVNYNELFEKVYYNLSIGIPITKTLKSTATFYRNITEEQKIKLILLNKSRYENK